ncbi:MAG: efflux RND transporter periplasmic adaptor subunit [Bacteroidota bacterium]
MANGNSKKKKIIIICIIIGVLLLLGGLVFWGSHRDKITTIQTEKIQRRLLTQLVTATGKIQPVVQVVINAEVSGEIIELPVKEGQHVQQGQLLVRIKPNVYQADYESALASLGVAEANLRKAESDFKRTSGLFEKKLVAESDMDVSRAAYQAAKSTDAQASALARESKETLNKTTIVAPMTGIVSKLNLELGERVGGSAFTIGTEIMTVADLSRMEARVDVGENDVVMVKLGDTARVDVDSYPGQKFTGIVTQIANTATTTGTTTQDQVTNFEVRILLHSPKGVEFRPGMSMSADIETETHSNVLTVPIQSVTVRIPTDQKSAGPEEGEAQLAVSNKKKDDQKLQEVVFIVKDGVAKTIPVKRGISDDSYVEVTGENLEGMEVVSGPFKAINRDLENGSKVKIDNKTAQKTGASADVDKK